MGIIQDTPKYPVIDRAPSLATTGASVRPPRRVKRHSRSSSAVALRAVATRRGSNPRARVVARARRTEPAATLEKNERPPAINNDQIRSFPN